MPHEPDVSRPYLGAIEELHQEDLVGTYDTADVDQQDGKAHIVKRMDRPMIRIIPEEFGFGPLCRKELKEAAAQLGPTRLG
jgi:hypothetical protein